MFFIGKLIFLIQQPVSYIRQESIHSAMLSSFQLCTPNLFIYFSNSESISLQITLTTVSGSAGHKSFCEALEPTVFCLFVCFQCVHYLKLQLKCPLLVIWKAAVKLGSLVGGQEAVNYTHARKHICVSSVTEIAYIKETFFVLKHLYFHQVNILFVLKMICCTNIV